MAAGSAVAMIGANLRFGNSITNASLNATRVFQCHPGGTAEAALIFTLGSLGMAANIALMGLILAKRQLRRWSQGLLFHQAMVDCARAALLLPLGISIYKCQPVNKCSLVETAFLLLVTVSTVNMLTTVVNDSPVFPQDENEENELTAPLLMDSPQCVLFGTFMIWFASITINLGPTFLSGALAANSETGHNAPSCPLVHGPFRHYVLNVLWIVINVICVVLTLFHLRKLHRDLTKANVEAVRVAGLVTTLVNVTGGSAPPIPRPVPPAPIPGPIRNSFSGPLPDSIPGPIPTPPLPRPPAISPRLGELARELSVSPPPGETNGDIHLPPIETLTRPASSAMEEHRRMRNYLRRMEKEGVQRVKMFLIITAAYVLFWGPLFFVTLVHHPVIGNPLGYEITLHISYIHAFINPTLFLVLHRGLRQAAFDACCGCCLGWPTWILAAALGSLRRAATPITVPPPPDPPKASMTDISLLKPQLPPPAQFNSSMGDTDLSPIGPDPWVAPLPQQEQTEPVNGGLQILHFSSPAGSEVASLRDASISD